MWFTKRDTGGIKTVNSVVVSVEGEKVTITTYRRKLREIQNKIKKADSIAYVKNDGGGQTNGSNSRHLPVSPETKELSSKNEQETQGSGRLQKPSALTSEATPLTSEPVSAHYIQRETAPSSAVTGRSDNANIQLTPRKVNENKTETTGPITTKKREAYWQVSSKQSRATQYKLPL